MGDDVLCPVLDLAGFKFAAAIQVYADVAASEFEPDPVIFAAPHGGHAGLIICPR
jgi:hypothetical protein